MGDTNDTHSEGLFNLDSLAKTTNDRRPLTQEGLVGQFCNDDSIFARINRARKIAEEEPEKQKIISGFLWYFSNRTLEETKKICDWVTQGRWKDDYVETPAPVREEVIFDEEEEKKADEEPRGVIGDGIFSVPESLHALLKKRMAELDGTHQ